MLSGAERNNGWQLAEDVGNTTPYGLLHLLGRVRSGADAGRDELRGYVLEYLGEETGVLIVDETCFLKENTKSVGVKRHTWG